MSATHDWSFRLQEGTKVVVPWGATLRRTRGAGGFAGRFRLPSQQRGRASRPVAPRTSPPRGGADGSESRKSSSPIHSRASTNAGAGLAAELLQPLPEFAKSPAGYQPRNEGPPASPAGPRDARLPARPEQLVQGICPADRRRWSRCKAGTYSRRRSPRPGSLAGERVVRYEGRPRRRDKRRAMIGEQAWHKGVKDAQGGGCRGR